MKIQKDILSIQVSELLPGKTADYYRIDLISRDYKDTYTIAVCPEHRNYEYWKPIVDNSTELCVALSTTYTLKGNLEDSICEKTGAVRLNADKKPTYTATHDRKEALAKLKDDLGINPTQPIADPFNTLFGYGEED